MRKITAIIPTFNEAHNIEAAIDSLSWADEIMVVDSFSTDDTLAIAKKKNARIIQRAYENSASQKNWAIPQASHEWIFLLDADERCTSELKTEIQQYLQESEIPHQAYWIKRSNYFMGKKVNFSGWQGDRVIRFFNRDTCKYENKKVHAEVKSTGTIGQLKNKIKHNTYRDMDHFVKKMKKYAVWSAEDHIAKTGPINFYHLQIKPLARFIRHYLIKGGFLDGKVGYQISKIMAKGVRWRYDHIKEMRSKR